MFWRKKKSDDVLFEVDISDRRKAVRLKPSSPLYLETDGHRYAVIDISSCGVACESMDVAVNDRLEISFKLPDNDETTYLYMQCEIQVLSTVEHIYHCVFLHLDVYQQMHLDRYILNEQKKQIRQTRK